MTIDCPKYQEMLRKKREQYHANKEKNREKRKRYREANKDKIKEKDRLYRLANLERIKEREKNYRTSNRERRRQRCAEYYAANREEIRIKRREYHRRTEVKAQRAAYERAKWERTDDDAKALANAKRTLARSLGAGWGHLLS